MDHRSRLPAKGLRMTLMAALCAAAPTAVPGAAAAQKVDKVTFAWPGSGSSSLAPFAFAKELGYYKDENLELDIVYLKGAAIVLPQLMQGIDFLIAVIGLFGIGEILMTMEEGLDFKGKAAKISPKVVFQNWARLKSYWMTLIRS